MNVSESTIQKMTNTAIAMRGVTIDPDLLYQAAVRTRTICEIYGLREDDLAGEYAEQLKELIAVKKTDEKRKKEKMTWKTA